MVVAAAAVVVRGGAAATAVGPCIGRVVTAAAAVTDVTNVDTTRRTAMHQRRPLSSALSRARAHDDRASVASCSSGTATRGRSAAAAAPQPMLTDPCHAHAPTFPFTGSVVFGGAGLLLSYQIGVTHYLQHAFDLSRTAFSGASGGAIVAALAACDVPMSVAQGMNLRMVHRASERPWTGPLVHGLPELEALLCEHLPCDDDVARLTDGRRLCISLTALPRMDGHLMTYFATRQRLAQAVIRSMNLPLFLSFHKLGPLDGVHYIDGGLSNNRPRAEMRNRGNSGSSGGNSDADPDPRYRSVTVSPSARQADISPRADFAARRFFLPGDAAFMRYLEEIGFNDAAASHELLLERGFVPKERHAQTHGAAARDATEGTAAADGVGAGHMRGAAGTVSKGDAPPMPPLPRHVPRPPTWERL